MLSDHVKIVSVLNAYRSILIQTKRASGFIAVKQPELGSKHFQNCVQFYDSAEEFGVSALSLMQVCLDSFSPWWCQKIFKRDYPPVAIAVSEKTRNRALKNFPKTLTTQPDELAQFYAEQLSGYGENIAKGLVVNGMCGDDPVMQTKVLDILAKERVR